MFSESKPERRRWSAAQVTSFALHVAVIAVVVWPAKPLFLMPHGVRQGEGGTSTAHLYMPVSGLQDSVPAKTAPEKPHNKLNLQKSKNALRVPKPQPKDETLAKNNSDHATQAPRAGTQYGSIWDGDLKGHDVRPALPVIFPDPAVNRSELPAGLEGDVIIEITIDAQGNVVDTRPLTTLGYGLEDKVIAAVRNWRFKPAMIDGRAMASQQDVHFHFPS